MNVNEVKIAILATDGFEHVELFDTKKFLDDHGVRTCIVSPNDSTIKAWIIKEWSDDAKVDMKLNYAKAADFDGLLLPGGYMNPDTLRQDEKALAFVRDFIKRDKPIAAICHGPQILIDADGVKGKTLTSWGALKMDLINAGANWVDQEVVKDKNLVTSRKPDDIPAFNNAMLELFGVTSQEKKQQM